VAPEPVSPLTSPCSRITVKGHDVDRSIDQLVQQLQGDEPTARCQAAEALAQLGEAAQAAAPVLVQACAVDDEELHEWVVSALEQLGPPAEEDLPALIKLLDAAELSAYWAVTLLGRLRERAAPAVPQLTECVEQSPHLPVRQRAIWALGQIGSAARAAALVLQQAAASPDARTARLAREAIEGLQQT
jgi:HEAT repeat protein